MAKICEQCGREFENRSVRCPICKRDLVSLEDSNTETTRMEQERMQHARQARQERMQYARQARQERVQHAGQVRDTSDTQVQRMQARQNGYGRGEQARGMQTRRESSIQERGKGYEAITPKDAQSNAASASVVPGRAPVPDRGMPELKDPYTWTPAFVKSHQVECLPRIREVNQLAILRIQRREYDEAAALVECMTQGLDVMNKTLPGNYRQFLFAYSLIGGILALNVDPFDFYEKMGISLVDRQGRTANLRELNQKNGNKLTRKSLAILYFLDARDYAQTSEAKQGMQEIVRVLEQGEDYEDITLEDAIYYLRDMDEKLAKAIAEGGVPSRSHGSSLPGTSVRTPVRKKGAKSMDFDDWMEGNGWGEEELEYAIKQVKLRRNIYGVLLLVPGLGFLLLPFWFRAVWLTRAMSRRDFDADFNFFENIVWFIYGLPTFYIYPGVMGLIIRWSNWGMGLGDQRGFVLNALLGSFILLLFLYTVFGPIPFIVCAVLLVAFFVIRWRRR